MRQCGLILTVLLLRRVRCGLTTIRTWREVMGWQRRGKWESKIDIRLAVDICGPLPDSEARTCRFLSALGAHRDGQPI